VDRSAEAMIHLRISVAVAARPIRATQTRVGEAYPSAQHHHGGGEHRTGQCQSTKPKRASFGQHESAYLRQLQQALHVLQHPFGLRVGFVKHHEIAKRIDQIDAV
jgi:hypothetical protein